MTSGGASPHRTSATAHLGITEGTHDRNRESVRVVEPPASIANLIGFVRPNPCSGDPPCQVEYFGGLAAAIRRRGGPGICHRSTVFTTGVPTIVAGVRLRSKDLVSYPTLSALL